MHCSQLCCRLPRRRLSDTTVGLLARPMGLAQPTRCATTQDREAAARGVVFPNRTIVHLVYLCRCGHSGAGGGAAR